MPAKKSIRLTVTCSFILALSFISSAFRFASAETFTTAAVHTLSVSSSPDKKSVSAGINDAVEITLPKEESYIQGIEINFKLPQKIAEQHEKLSWSLYKGTILVFSDESSNIFSGTRIALGSFGNSLSLVLKVPLYPDSQIRKDAYSYYIPNTAESYGEKLLLRIQGTRQLSEEDLKSSFIEISAKPIFIEKSRLFIKLRPPANKEAQPCTIFVDGKPCSLDKNGLLVSPGIHDISVTSDFYRNELRAVNVETAKDTHVEIELRDIAPLLRIIAPEGTKIFVDEQPVANTQNYFTLPQGEHTLRLRLGNYEIIRSITALNGRSYSLNLTLEASVSVEE
ncbi:MAG: PEGA domain-containing protein [Treponema sp.]|nr:PEGA domain-containing protein [Treponema sp.]